MLKYNLILMDMVQIKDLGPQKLEDTVVFKEKRVILVERENNEPIEVIITETYDGNVFVDVKLRSQDFTNSTYITSGNKFLSGKVNFDYNVIVDVTKYHDDSIVCEYTKENTHKPRKIVLTETKKEE